MSFFIADVIIFVLKNIVLISNSPLRLLYLIQREKTRLLRIEEAVDVAFLRVG